MHGGCMSSYGNQGNWSKTHLWIPPVMSILFALLTLPLWPKSDARAGEPSLSPRARRLAGEDCLSLTTGQLYLVFDPRLRGINNNCELKLHSFTRHPANPVMQPEKRWEGVDPSKPGGLGRIQLYGSVHWEPDSKVFKMWYLAATGLPENQGDVAVCYATSSDGIHWHKPSLELHELYGSKANNVSSLGDVVPIVYRDPGATDAGKRYVKWSLQTRDGDDGVKANYSIYRFFSADGLRWKRETRDRVLPGHPTRYLDAVAGDVVFTYWFPGLKKFVCFHRVEPKNPNPAPNDQPAARLSLRQFARFESTDGMRWSKPTWAFFRDEKDRKSDPYVQFYGVSVHPVGDLYLAFPWLYHSNEGDFDIGFAYSADTVTWERSFRGQYVLPKALAGTWDSAMLFTSAHLIEKDGLWWLYYTGCPYPHRKDKRYVAIGLAQMPKGRVVSARAWRKLGSWTIGPVRLPKDRVPGRRLSVNAAVFDTLRVQILDEQEMPLPGWESAPVRGNGIDLPVDWGAGQNLAALADRPVKLRFLLDDAEVFGFTCR